MASFVDETPFHHNSPDNGNLNLSIALELARAGLPILAAAATLNRQTGRWDKKPAIKGWQNEATTDEAKLREWWREHADYVPGIELGRADLVVIDADRHGGADGVAALEKLAEGVVDFSLAPAVATAGGGRHFYFHQPVGQRLGNRSGALPAGVDVRGVGGWIVAPGAVRPDGARWLPLDGAPLLVEALRNRGIPTLPEVIHSLIRRRPITATKSNGRHQADERRHAAYAKTALDHTTAELAKTAPGGRNNALNASAFRMGRMVERGWIGAACVADALRAASKSNGLVGDDGEGAVQQTLASGLEAGRQHPHPDLQDWHQANRYDLGTKSGESPQGLPEGEELVCQRAADITPTKVEWVWPGRLAIGKHTCIAGEPGTGKSQISFFVAAMVTIGGAWPCNEGRTPKGSVIILSAEDDAADTIIPRLIAAGADLSRVHVISAVHTQRDGRRTFNLQRDLALLEKKIAELGDVVFIIIDPVSSYLGKTDSHKNSEVRGVLEPLSEMAARMKVAVLSITHFSKGSGGNKKALHRFIGSIAFTGAPRAAFAVIADAEAEGRHLLLHAKNNLTKPPQGLAYRLEQELIEGDILASRVTWEAEPVNVSADEALAADMNGTDHTATEDAIEFLKVVLADGPAKVEAVEQEAKAAGLLGAEQSIGQSKPFRSARKRLGITPYQPKGVKGGGWEWALPAPTPHQVPSGGIRCPPRRGGI